MASVGNVHRDAEHPFTTDSSPSPGSEQSIGDLEGSALSDESGELSWDDDAPESPITPPSTYEIDRRLESDVSTPAQNEPGAETNPRPHPVRLPSTVLILDEQITRQTDVSIESVPRPLYPSLFANFLSSSKSQRRDVGGFTIGAGTNTNGDRFRIDINFSVASRENWSLTSQARVSQFAAVRSRTPRRYNLRPRPRLANVVVASSASVDSAVGEKYITLEDESKSPDSSDPKAAQRSSKSPPPHVSITVQRLSNILPIDTRIRLQEDSRICVSLTTKHGNPRCRNNARASDEILQNVPSTLTGTMIKSTDPASLSFVEELIGRILCGGAHRKRAQYEFEQICKGLDDMTEEDRSAFDTWTMALASEPHLAQGTTPVSPPETATAAQRAASPGQCKKTSTVASAGHRPVTRSISRAYPSVPNTIKPYVQNFKPWQPKGIARRTIKDVLKDVMQRPLSGRELSGGHIYMYWFPGNFGHLKIGTTTGDTAKRLDRWRKQCKHAVECPDSDLAAVNHVFRVEALIHAELKDVRYREDGCRGCGGNHREWFRERYNHARRVFDKWAAFIAEDPYVCVNGASGTEYVLKADYTQHDIDELCQPLQRIDQIKKTTRITVSPQQRILNPLEG